MSVFLFPAATNRSGLHYAWRGPSILVVDGGSRVRHDALTGWYFRQARYLSRLELELAGRTPHICSIADVAPNTLEATYIFPEVERGGGGGSGSGGLGRRDGLLFRNFDVRLRSVVHPASIEITLILASRWQHEVALDVAWRIGADFAPLDDVLFGRIPDSRSIAGGVVFRHVHEVLRFETHVRATGAQWMYDGARLGAHVRFERQRPVTLTLHVRAVDDVDPIDSAGERARDARVDEWQQDTVQLYAPGEPPFVEFANRAADDLGSFALLDGAEDEWLTPGAGVPLYLMMWGRDALTASWQAGLLDRGTMLGDVLTCLTRLQGTRVDPARDEEPGRIINQAKRDPASRVGVSPFDRYYADVASPFMFIIGLGYYYTLTGDLDRVRRHMDAAQRVLEWAEQYGDRDGDGYIEYLTKARNGPRHQGWKDSENAVVYEDGRQVDPPIAACEIQGYYHVSLQFMAALSAATGDRSRGLELWRRARELKERFNRDFWMDDEGFVAFGLDAEKRQIRALTSNGAQCLPTGIVSDDHIPRLVRRMFEPDLFSGWGIRTLSTGNAAYNPLDYHLGSVWPVENASILFGLRRYGFDDRALELARALYDLARLWPGGRTPECVGGYDRDEFEHPGAYPQANRPQMWNQSIWPILTQSLLGIVPCAPLGLLLVDPVLPAWLPELTVKRLRVGDAIVSLRFERDADGASRWEVVEQQGTLRVVRQPWLESFSSDLLERIGGLAEAALR